MNENEFLILLQAKLDEAKSKDNINTDIDKIQKDLNKLKLQATIDSKSISDITRQLEHILNQKITISNIQIDTNQIASYEGKKLANDLNKTVQKSLSIDNILDKQIENLMSNLSIAGKKGSKAFNDIRQSVLAYKNELSNVNNAVDDPDDIFSIFGNSANINNVTSTLAKYIKYADDVKIVYSDLSEYIKKINASGVKIHLPNSIKEEYGDDFPSMVKQLGKAFTTKSGGDFESFVKELNDQLGNVIDMSNGAEAAFGDLVDKINSTKGNKYLSGDELFDSGILNRKELEDLVISVIKNIDDAEEKLAHSSVSSTNTVVMNEEKKQQAIQETANAFKTLSDEESIIKSGAGAITFDATNNAAKEAQQHFKTLLENEQAIIATTEKFDKNNILDSFIVNIKRASGEVESLRYCIDTLQDEEGNIVDVFYRLKEGSINDAGAIKQIQKIENTFATYTQKIEQFKSTNSNILSGLSVPLTDFENKLNGLRNGTSSVDEVKNSFSMLKAEASKVVSNLSGELNKVDKAVRNISKGQETISGLRAEFKGLNNAPKEINSELNKLSIGLSNIKKIESQEGRIANWTKAYKEWEDAVNSLKAKLSALKKEQANVASTQIFKTSDLRKDNIAYMTKVSNTIEKQMDEIQKMANAKGWSDFKVQGFEKADGKIQQLTLTVTEAEGAIKKLNFQREKLQGNGKAQDGLMQTGDVQIIKTASQAQEELSSNAKKANNELNNQITVIQKSIDNGYGISEYQNRIKRCINDLEKYGVSTEKATEQTALLQQTFDQMKGLSGQELISKADKFEQEFKAVKISIEDAKLSFDKFTQPVSNEKATTLILRIQRFLKSNTKITEEAKSKLEDYIKELNGGNVSLSQLNQINTELKKTEYQMSLLGRLGKSFKDQMAEISKNISSYLSISAAFMTMVSKTKEAVVELKEIDNILTEISKTSDLTSQELEKLGNTSFKTAGKYGKDASDYLSGIQEMYRAGFTNADEMAELSVLAQSAGDLQRNTADDYLIATNAAYNLKGNVEKLNDVLDSQNYITNHAAVSMEDMAQATSEAASIAAQYGVQIDELSALTAVAVSKTRESGSEVGNALKSIFINLQDTTKQPIVDVFDELDISMTKFVNGAEILKTPIELLKELSESFTELPEGSILRSNVLNDIGSKYHANTLAAILSDFDSYYNMLDLYNQGSGSAMEEAMKSANNLSGSLNRLGNTWTSIVNNVIDTDALISVTNGFNSVLSVVETLTSALGSLGTIGIGAGLFTGIKNVGSPKMFGLKNCLLFNNTDSMLVLLDTAV